MASTSNTATMNQNQPTFGSDPSNSSNTTFVQADPSTFRTIVQKLTGAPDEPSTPKLPLTHQTRPINSPGPKRPAFKLQERRPSARNLQINLYNNSIISSTIKNSTFDHGGLFHLRQRGFLVSPVSTLDFFAGRASPTSPCEEEEERAIAEKGFYLHPSPRNTPRGSDPPELLPLFPLQSPRDKEIRQDDDSSFFS
ncbi:hypothetical protein K2173_009376 [Erythroxylum novogranatense]|uniref:VQ domain-containing protein n=1 Tax=Erythroxylum novogranatense TaxID=1862640 RepID=A0AAV8U6I1_9ROSI|nr:hypothetical protein K2173_009376 [Erythroxylum novogranatense]